MRNLPILFLFAIPVFAQDQASAALSAAGCGPQQVQFDVKTDKNQHILPQPEAGKALVYVFRNEKRSAAAYIGTPNMRTGIDGKWEGANRADGSYFWFSVDPGEHHLCVDLDSTGKNLQKVGTATAFSAEAGKVYYFNSVIDRRLDRQLAVTIKPVDAAEGPFLIGTSSLSTALPRK